MKKGDLATWISPFGDLYVVLHEEKLHGWLVDISPLKYRRSKYLFARRETLIPTQERSQL